MLELWYFYLSVTKSVCLDNVTATKRFIILIILRDITRFKYHKNNPIEADGCLLPRLGNEMKTLV